MDSRVEEVSFLDSEPNPSRRSRFVDSSLVLHCSCAKAASSYQLVRYMDLEGHTNKVYGCWWI